MTNMVEMYAKAYTEVYTIVNTLDNNEKNKIPHEEIEKIIMYLEKQLQYCYIYGKNIF